MKVLAIDSSGLVASVAVVEDENLLAKYTIHYKKTHSQTLLPMLDEITRMTEMDLAPIDAIAIAAGPGSFTGLRIGSATAKGLGLALKKPIVEIPTTEAMAYGLYGVSRHICPIMDARREQVYTGIYSFEEKDGKSVFRIIKKQCAMSISELAEVLNLENRPVIFTGDGIPVYREKLETLLQVPYEFAPASCNRQNAASVGVLALSYMEEGKIVDAAGHRPDYLRPSQAERELQEKEQQEREILQEGK